MSVAVATMSLPDRLFYIFEVPNYQRFYVVIPGIFRKFDAYTYESRIDLKSIFSVIKKRTFSFYIKLSTSVIFSMICAATPRALVALGAEDLFSFLHIFLK